jgi:5-methylcytosine-specific restriction endonuclease McrA
VREQFLHRRCKQCGATGLRKEWPRYERNGRLSNFCSTCHAQNEERLRRSHEKLCQRCGHAPAVIHSQCRACDHIFKRQQREREALAQGREIVAYRPQQVRESVSAWAKVEAQADRIRRRWAAAYLRPFRKLSAADDAELAAERAARARTQYAQRRIEESERTKRYKAANPERKLALDAVRNARIEAQSDGSVSAAAITKLKRFATHCAYCDVRLLRKQTDHMITLALGGEHSLRNIVIVCPECNLRKHKLSYEQWIDRIEEQHRPRVAALFSARYGARVAAA